MAVEGVWYIQYGCVVSAWWVNELPLRSAEVADCGVRCFMGDGSDDRGILFLGEPREPFDGDLLCPFSCRADQKQHLR